MTTHTNRSENYRFTVNNDAEGHIHIAQLRKQARIFNAEERLKALKDSSYARQIAKVDIFGRLGKNNVNAQSYRDAAKKQRENFIAYWGANPYQRVAIADAKTIDCYLRTCVDRPVIISL